VPIFAGERRRERHERLAEREQRVEPHHAVIGVAREAEQMMVVEPELADDDEADQPAHEFRRQLDERMAQLSDAGRVRSSSWHGIPFR